MFIRNPYTKNSWGVIFLNKKSKQKKKSGGANIFVIRNYKNGRANIFIRNS